MLNVKKCVIFFSQWVPSFKCIYLQILAHFKCLIGLINESLGLFCGEGNGTPLQYSCLENPMDEGAWWAAVHGVANNQT